MCKNTNCRNTGLLSAFIAVFIIIFLTPSVVLADAGPKPSITIKAVNMPDKICYMDLLVEVDEPGEVDPDFLTDDFNQDMIAILSSYTEGGWGACVVNRERITFDGVKCNIVDGEATKNFGYMPPDRFKIIVVTEDGTIQTSNIIEKKAFDSTIDFDYKTGVATERPILPGYLMKFIITLIVTLIIEGLLFLAFKFGFKKYWGWILGINVLTQIFLYAAIIFGTLTGGIFFAIIMYILAEFLIFIGETIAYAFILKSKTIGYRLGYSFAANTLSLIVGILLFGILI